jgi:hypothetical protein
MRCIGRYIISGSHDRRKSPRRRGAVGLAHSYERGTVQEVKDEGEGR